MTTNFNNVSPLRYVGGKTRACKIIDEVVAKYFDVNQFDTLISPFFGGGSFEFYFQNKYNAKLIVNDKFTPLCNFWLQTKNNKIALCDALKNINVVTKEQFANYRNTIMDLHDNPLQQATQYFILNRCSFSGATLSGGFSAEASAKRYTLSSIDRIYNMDLSNVDIYNEDFAEFLNRNFDGERRLIFLDPPYYLDNSKLYGKNGDMHENFNHQQLFDMISKKHNWILTYNNCEYVRNLYKNFTILDVDWKYGMNATKQSSEIIILSIRMN